MVAVGRLMLAQSMRVRSACTAASAALPRLEVDAEGVATATLCDVRRANPLSLEVMQRLFDWTTSLASSTECRVVILRHEGNFFSSGHDLNDLFDRSRDWAPHSAERQRQVFRVCTELNLRLQALPQPVIAAVDGVASAGGCQLAASCDLVFATKRSTLATPGSTRGRFCHTPGVALAEKIHPRKALEMLLLGAEMSAHEAHTAGLVNRVVEDAEDLQAEVARVAQQLCGTSASNLQQGKQAFYACQTEATTAAKYRIAEDAMVKCFQSPDAAEATRSFFQKRRPVFKH
eukprot:TRINITY_DN51516_c0_g1_i1.p1 TRINITY_DN51516_c0_g1~~TRINITY_DN51516_c0_g1_i1.p1  ORF type:complete len:289 (+),score=59.40 TRINITY_DN51516_c0_g1_i1:70-936(+)